MIDIVKDRCAGCFACKSKCPKNCIELKPDKEGFLYPIIDYKKCVNCGLCNSVCPILNIKSETDKEITAYAAFIKGEEVRFNSSSGGLFTAIAESIIEKGGVAFGAAFDKNFDVIHKYVETKDELSIFRGSKYVQSDIGETYKQAKGFLEQGRIVFFTGTPCQIGGLYSYLGKEYKYLITQDFICHGVPSPMVWRKYLEYREDIAQSRAREISFRRKNYGWNNYSVWFKFSNGTEHVSTLLEDPYMKVFLSDLCLRSSCYNCAFKTKYRQADITLADFWGVSKILPEINDDKGTSLLILHSSKGKEIFKSISDKIYCCEVNVDDAIKFNSAMIKSVAKPNTRDLFMKSVKNKSFEKAINIATQKKDKKISVQVFKNDVASVKQEKGAVYAILYWLKHFWKVYF